MLQRKSRIKWGIMPGGSADNRVMLWRNHWDILLFFFLQSIFRALVVWIWILRTSSQLPGRTFVGTLLGTGSRGCTGRPGKTLTRAEVAPTPPRIHYERGSELEKFADQRQRRKIKRKTQIQRQIVIRKSQIPVQCFYGEFEVVLWSDRLMHWHFIDRIELKR